MAVTPEPVMGQTPPSGLGPAPGPVPTALRNVAVMDQRISSGEAGAARGSGGRTSRRRSSLATALLDVPRRWRDPRSWQDMANLLLVSPIVGILFASATLLGLVASALTAWIIGLGVAVSAWTLRLSAQMARFDRRRIERVSGSHIEPLALPRREPGASIRAYHRAWARAPWLWRMPAYQMARVPVVGVLVFGAVVWWWAIIICFVLAAQPSHSVPLLGLPLGPLHLSGGEMAVLVVTGVAGIVLWPTVLRVVPAVDVALGRWLLGPSRTGQLSAEVARLGEARSLALEAEEAERRRIERDLHDGLQPELVNLALDLGLAKSRLRSDPDAAWLLVERAHEEAKRAAEDLRNLVRGIHPSVLDERGLDAALSGLVASCTVPVSVIAELPHRPPAKAEGTAYFVVAEAVTNITKHAHARKAVVHIDYMDGALRVVVEDDGRGGARLEPTGGLAGLAARVASMDGTFTLHSRDGGPTRIEAVIPCEP